MLPRGQNEAKAALRFRRSRSAAREAMALVIGSLLKVKVVMLAVLTIWRRLSLWNLLNRSIVLIGQ
jgi:uncharacterized membrane protein